MGDVYLILSCEVMPDAWLDVPCFERREFLAVSCQRALLPFALRKINIPVGASL